MSRQLYETTSDYYRIIQGKHCAYCGTPADGEDHVFPISAMYKLVISGNTSFTSFVVPACGECNSFPGDKIFSSLNEKREYIRDSLRKKYAHLLKVSSSIDELIWETDQSVLLILADLRDKKKLEERLCYQHTYDLSLKNNLEDEYNSSSITLLKTEEYITRPISGNFRVNISRYNVSINQTFRTLKEAQTARDNFLNYWAMYAFTDIIPEQLKSYNLTRKV